MKTEVTSQKSRFLEIIASKRHSTPYFFGINCCTQTVFQAFTSAFNVQRLGIERPTRDPALADLLVVTGIVNADEAPQLKDIWNKMTAPKKAIAFGACSITGGVFRESPNRIETSKIIPIDLFLPGCPPSIEAFIRGILDIRESKKFRD